MNNIEVSSSAPDKKPRFGLIQSMLIIGFSGNQAIYGTSDATAARMLDDPALEQFSWARAGIGFSIAAAGICYVYRHYRKKPTASSEIVSVAPEKDADILPLKELPVEVENTTKEAASPQWVDSSHTVVIPLQRGVTDDDPTKNAA